MKLKLMQTGTYLQELFMSLHFVNFFLYFWRARTYGSHGPRIADVVKGVFIALNQYNMLSFISQLKS